MKIVLSMIAWNEGDVIARAIESCVGIIDYAVIVIDNRTTDDTKRVAESVLKHNMIPYKIIHKKWVNFATNRNVAMELSRKTGCDYSLILDADEVIVPEDFDKDSLTHDGYFSEVEYGNQKFASLRLINLHKDWYWEGAIHNQLCLENCGIMPNIASLKFFHYHDGHRSKDPGKIVNDVKILKKLVKKHPDDARYRFYYAQTLREAGMLDESIEQYKKRITMGGFDEEIWYSMMMIGAQYRIMDKFDDALVWYTKAFQYRPWRSESIYHLSVYCRTRNYRHLAYMYSRMALSLKRPESDLLFVEFAVYDYLALFEYGIASYWVGNFQESFDSNLWLLNNVILPKEYFDQVKVNLDFAAKKLGIDTKWGNYSDGTGNRLIYYNDGMSTFGENYIKNYGFERIALEKTNTPGMLWFGVCSTEEYDALIATTEEINMHWCGPDVLYCINDPRIEQLAAKTNINFTCENEQARQELLAHGIDVRVFPMFSESVNDFAGDVSQKVYDVAVYAHPNKRLYNRDLMIQVSDAMPDVKFTFLGDDTVPVSDNRDVDGWLSQDAVKSVLRASKCYLLVTEHGGFPDLMVKAHLLGLHVISNVDAPYNVMVNKDLNTITTTIKNCINMQTKPEIQYFYRMSGIINNWKEIMKHGYDKFLQLQGMGQEGEGGVSESVSEPVENQ